MNGNDASGLARTAPYNREPRSYDFQRGPEGWRDNYSRPATEGLSAEATFAIHVDDILAELGWLMEAKQRDYGPKNISESPGGAMNGLIVRMNDKMQRLINLHYSDKKPSNESIEDTFMDIANYGIIGLMLLRGTWPK